MNRILRAGLLVFAFLFAQAGAAVHAAGHIAAASQESNGKALPADGACELCVAYAQLAGSAPLPAHPDLPVCSARYQTPEALAPVFYTRTLVHSRARAPPVHSV